MKEDDTVVSGQVKNENSQGDIDAVADLAHVRLFEVEETSGGREGQRVLDMESVPATEFHSIRLQDEDCVADTPGAHRRAKATVPDGCHNRNGTSTTQRPSQLGLIIGDVTPPHGTINLTGKQ